MHTLVLADTNLAIDTRMKRHIRTLLELGQRVTALLFSGSDAAPGLEADGLQVVAGAPEITRRADAVQELAGRLGLTPFVFRAFPGRLVPRSFEWLGPFSDRVQAGQLGSGRWDELHQSACKEGVDPRDDYVHLCCSFETMLQWAESACNHSADCVYCVDLPTLLAGVAHKLKYGSRLLFDAHEIFCDIAPGAQTRLFKHGLALLELHLVGLADVVLGVSESHADWMRRTYDLPAERVLCVPNCFAMGQAVGPPPHREPANPLRLYYHGNGDPFRGLDTITRAVATVPDIQLVLRCPPSPTMDEIPRLAAELGIAARVKVLPLVPPDEMIDAVRAEADVGIHITLDRPVSLTLKVALTNKFIEYLMAGIPVLTAPLEEQARLVREHDVGFVLPGNSVEAIRAGLLWMQDNRGRLAEMGQRAHRVGVARFSWQAIRQTLVRALDAGERGLAPPGGGNQPRFDEVAFWSAMAEAAYLQFMELQSLNERLDTQVWWLTHKLTSPRACGKQFVKVVSHRLLRASWHALPRPIRNGLRPAVGRLMRWK